MPIESVIQPLSGNISTIVLDPSGTVPGEITIVRLSDPWQVKVHWDISGGACSSLASDANWVVNVLVESLGPGREDSVLPAPFKLALGVSASSHSYDKTFDIPAAAFPDLTPGVYKLVTLITLETLAKPMAVPPEPSRPLPIAAYQEGPVIQFYTAS